MSCQFSERIKILILEAANLLLSDRGPNCFSRRIFPPGTTPPRPLSHLSYDLLMWVPYPLLSAPSATHMSPTLRNRLAFRPRPCLFHLEYLGPPIPCHRMRPFNRTRSDCAIIAVLKSYEIFVHSLG
ncbi:uncharacterized protein LOC116404444 [Cucumis sativus]|uniref:uncharacterized protein LOC116404444 n=1 Tax=Cucumis sativus TaxID=3659 RepID=UPI0012F5270D|nr:uncharacterized protein LOC116404444 [Cucumis sativus]